MATHDLTKLISDADARSLRAALRATIDAIAWYVPVPAPDYNDTDDTIARREARAEVAQDTLEAIREVLTTASSDQPSG
ncbi:hypothetical protein OG689_44590 [Kitasatospora sp. NBC_00240]|uniref:hypothetical protein n=1 Tax=Kitasatospora sp. NBC_00240 TaxID=2903567 RepID=UPI002254F429|nr:hypothetical protein [Kitasatospora sp. NBC_00240]MCX5216218.1 hypothetical protein [Kitasatospora sp. NBC_00240]